MIRNLAAIAFAALAGCTAAAPGERAPAALPAPGVQPAATRILDPAAAERLRSNAGITLQWIDWKTRGTAAVRVDGGVWHLTGAQAEAGGPGRLFLDGTIAEIGKDYFTFDGTVRIADTPDRARRCEANKRWTFAVTQNRPYWRLREFEWCDGLTDYVDIYFPGTAP